MQTSALDNSLLGKLVGFSPWSCTLDSNSYVKKGVSGRSVKSRGFLQSRENHATI